MRTLCIIAMMACNGSAGTDTSPPVPPPWPDGETLHLETTIIGVPVGIALGPNFMAVGAAERTLRLDPAFEVVTGDVEGMPGYPEEVVGAGVTDTSDVALVRTPTDLRLINFDPVPGGISEFYEHRDVRRAAMTPSGAILVLYRYETNKCGLRWLDQEAPLVDDLACVTTEVAVADDNTVLVGMGRDGLWWVDRDSATKIAPEGLFVAWEPTLGRVWHGLAGQNWLAATSPEGEEQLRITLDGSLQALVGLGNRGELIWAEDTPVGSHLVRADAEGVATETLTSERVITSLYSDPAGTRIAVQRTGDLGTYQAD